MIDNDDVHTRTHVVTQYDNANIPRFYYFKDYLIWVESDVDDVQSGALCDATMQFFR